MTGVHLKSDGYVAKDCIVETLRYIRVQGTNGLENDREKPLDYQRDTIKKVTIWLREEGLEPQEITHLRKDANYYGVVISNETETMEQTDKQRRRAFHILFPTNKLDSLRISEIIIFDLQSQKSYASLAAKANGILQQNKFYFDLESLLLQMKVHFIIKKNLRELQSVEVYKVIYFDGLTKNAVFDAVDTVHNSIEIARIKTSQLRDSIVSNEANRGKEDKILSGN